MIKEFSERFRGRKINKHTLHFFTRYRLADWIRITGFFDGEISNQIILAKDVKLVPDDYPIFHLVADKIDLEITINIENLTISNVSIYLTERRRKIGTKAHINQINVAKEFGFKYLEVPVAAGGSKHLDGFFNGSITWAKFGYTMLEKSHSEFLTEMKKEGVNADCLQKLLSNRKNDDFWIRNGTEWSGVFDLSEQSINRRILNIYLHRT